MGERGGEFVSSQPKSAGSAGRRDGLVPILSVRGCVIKLFHVALLAADSVLFSVASFSGKYDAMLDFT